MKEHSDDAGHYSIEMKTVSSRAFRFQTVILFVHAAAWDWPFSQHMTLSPGTCYRAIPLCHEGRESVFRLRLAPPGLAEGEPGGNAAGCTREDYEGEVDSPQEAVRSRPFGTSQSVCLSVS